MWTCESKTAKLQTREPKQPDLQWSKEQRKILRLDQNLQVACLKRQIAFTQKHKSMQIERNNLKKDWSQMKTKFLPNRKSKPSKNTQKANYTSKANEFPCI